ncbi:MAG: EscU/YscU/HrcU family type III secretion system export apparatus switch protein, partial [Polymorphobacter sp.]
MADAPDPDQKTEAPSEKRLREAAERGDVLQSRELGVALAIVGASAWLLTMAPDLFDASLAVMQAGLSFAAPAPDFDPLARLVEIARPLLVPLLAFAAMTIAGVIAGP